MLTQAWARQICLCTAILSFAPITFCQTESGMVSGRLTDVSGAIVAGAAVQIESIDRGTSQKSISNGAGIYSFPSIQPGRYHVTITKPGFRQIEVVDLVVNVQDHIEKNFVLQVGSISESITVAGGAPLLNTEDASVNTVVDRNFADNLPMNGRSFQTLIDLTPGVVLTTQGSSGLDSGQFSVNGQRASSNYWMVDGVSANLGSSTLFGGNGAAGAVGTSSVLGGTNSLVSVDSLQEFRIQTSTFAPEFGRTPGAQISIVTRSGGNQFHGSVFDYLRNDIFDANDWFNGYTNNPPLHKAEERQNDFGGTLSGPIIRNRSFFFFSYEGLRLRLPITTLTAVPDLNARATASSAMQPYLNAYPFDPKQPELGSGAAQFNASYSNPATLDDYALRIDHRFSDSLALFGRYNYSPSLGQRRGDFGNALSSVLSSRITIQTGTVGANWSASKYSVNEFRFNYSRTDPIGKAFLDNFGGAVPLSSLPFPQPYTGADARLLLRIFSLPGGAIETGTNVRNLQRQVNLIDSFSVQKESHDLKFGVDYRRLYPSYSPFRYGQLAFFTDVPSAQNGTLLGSIVNSQVGATLLFRNLGTFLQDTWHVIPRLTLTYGLRWDVDFAPSSLTGPGLPAASGFNLTDLSQLALAPAGTPAFKTPYGGVAPRVGLAYQLAQAQGWGTVLRGGVGVFYDLATSEAGNILLRAGYPFSSPFIFNAGGTFPLSAAAAAPPPIEPPNAQNQGALAAFDPNLRLPYTLEWNGAIEQGLGQQQALTIAYVGSAGRRLIQTAQIAFPNPNIGQASLVANGATSDYHALQLQFQRRLLAGLQGLASYTWSHSIDTASAGSPSNGSNSASSGANGNENRGSSDFDIRHAFSGGLTYLIPGLRSHSLIYLLTRGWSLQTIIQAHSSAPVGVLDGNFVQLANGFSPDIRPDVAPGIPLYLYGRQYPGGKAINNIPGAVSGGCPDGSTSVGPFCPPPSDPNGNALRQGNFPRNALRGFRATQWDLAVHRDIAIRESTTLQFRAEMFNVLNHPNFGPPVGDITQAQFGLSTQMLNQYLGGSSLGSGSFSPLYQIGGPRSMQFALKLSF